MKKWQPLKKGDVVDIIAPGSGKEFDEVKAAAKYLKSIGLVPRYPQNIFGKDLFCSNTDEKRFEQLKAALYANDSAAIWCFRGGYGTARLISKLAKLKPPAKNKLVIGFSDITSLHLFLMQEWNWNVLHASVIWQIIDKQVNDLTIKKTEQVIFGKIKKNKFRLTLLNKISGNINSTITGGNLTLITNSIGTIWQMNSKGKIIFIEDVDEPAYRIDRNLLHLEQAGLFDKAEAIIFGDFNSEKVKIDSKKIDLGLKRFAENISAPVFRVKNIGHKKTNYPLPMGSDCTISKTDNNYLLEVDSGHI